MNRQITPLSVVILVAVGVVAGMLTMVISNIQRGESLHKSYERGYEDARSVLLDTLYNRWFNDSLGWGSIDSTDTMSAVESVDTAPPNPLYEKIVYDEYGAFSVYPPDTTIGDYLVNGYNIDRIDTVEVSFVDSVMYEWREGYTWVAMDDSTLGRFYIVGDDKGDIVGFYREQGHLKRGVW